MFLRSLGLIFIMCTWLTAAHATLFRNSYVSFELPPNWECKLDGTEWVCISKYAKESKEAIIILTAKEVGPVDTLATYMAHLKSPRSIPDKSGALKSSEVISTQQRMIGNHPWIDGMQKGSEITSYYTRYLATIKEKLAILVTFSAHIKHYTKYSNDFLKSVESLRVVAAKDILDAGQTSSQSGVGGIRGVPIVDTPLSINTVDLPAEPKKQDLTTKLIALALLIGAIGIYLWRRKK